MAQALLALQPVMQELSAAPSRLPSIPWRDPHTVSPVKLAEYIQALETQCGEPSDSADLRTCLGMAYAMNYDVYRSLDSFEAAVQLDPSHFFAQLKYSELLYRIRTLHRAEEETLRALDLANNGWELSLARAQLKEIRRLLRKGNDHDSFLAASSNSGWRRSRPLWISPHIPMKWRFLIGAAILGTMLVLSAGAPPIPVALGVALVLLLNLYEARKV